MGSSSLVCLIDISRTKLLLFIHTPPKLLFSRLPSSKITSLHPVGLTTNCGAIFDQSISELHQCSLLISLIILICLLDSFSILPLYLSTYMFEHVRMHGYTQTHTNSILNSASRGIFYIVQKSKPYYNSVLLNVRQLTTTRRIESKIHIMICKV